ncbi:MAG: nuclear transport factor 2 family protein [Candidatus Cybelea sp.]
MNAEANGLKAIAQNFFSAYDAHDVDGMVALCADGALGRYLPLGRNSLMPIRGGIDNIWRAFPKAVPLFRVEVVEMILAEGSTVIVQAMMSGPIPADPLGIAKDGEDVGHCYILRYDPKGKIARLDCYWDNAVLNGIVKSKL